MVANGVLELNRLVLGVCTLWFWSGVNNMCSLLAKVSSCHKPTDVVLVVVGVDQ